MKICVVGPNGMLGEQVMLEAHRRGHQVQGSPRTHLGDHSPYKGLDIVLWQEADVVINCAGVRPGGRARDMILANALGPWELAQHTATLGMKFIHMSTDCVFSGQPPASVLDRDTPPDATELYGRSKLLGEPTGDHVLVVRGSFIGLKHGFLRWLLDSKGTVSAWSKAYWNGTSAQRMAACLVDYAEDFQSGVVHAAAEDAVSKAWMVEYIVDQLNLPVNIVVTSSPQIHRALMPDYVLPSVKDSIDELLVECKKLVLQS